MDSITDKRAEAAIKFLCQTDEQAAVAKSYMVGLEKQEKTVLATEMLKSLEKSAAMKEQEARCSESYQEWQKKYENDVYDFEIARNKRNSASMTVELWRSVNANRNRGNV